MEDGAIVELYWERSEKAISATSEKYGSYCYSIAYGILSNAQDSEESVNDTYLEAWNSMPPHRPSVLSAFLGKITRRKAIDRWPARNAEKRGGGESALVLEELEGILPAGRDAESELEAAELSAAINSFVRSLPAVQRHVFVCRYWYIDSIQDISRRFGFSQGKVKTMLYRLRKKLLTYLEKEGIL